MICLKPSSWLASQKVDKNVQLHGRSPYGERGLKSLAALQHLLATVGRSPYGERGLKFDYLEPIGLVILSLSLRRAWIEITEDLQTLQNELVALLTESVD